MSPHALADLVLAIHVAFVAFVVGGFALILAGLAKRWAWVRHPGFRWAHMTAIALVAVEALAGMACPLTVLEDALRPSGADGASFIGRWLRRLLYWDLPPWSFTAAYCLFAAAVAYVMWRHPPRGRREAKRLSSSEVGKG